jgi:hypothetical protein
MVVVYHGLLVLERGSPRLESGSSSCGEGEDYFDFNSVMSSVIVEDYQYK